MKKLLVVAAALAVVLSAGSAFAAKRGGFQQENMYVGGGLSMNSLSGFDDAVGWQIFAGYELDQKLGDASLAVEVGYWNSGEFETTVTIFPLPPVTVTAEAKGLWATAVADLPFDKQWSGLGRLGFDFGDDDGLMLGIGAGYNINKEMQIRAEYVIRDNVDSIQANFVYRF